MKVIKYSAIAIALAASGCGMMDGDNKEEDAGSETNTGGTISAGNGAVTATGTLALAFPTELNIGSAFVGDTEAAALSLVESEEIPSAEEKAEELNAIFASTTLADCFKAVETKTYSQPACFAPNLSRTDWSAATDQYTVALADGVNELLYGDGGIVKEDEDNESCSAATINFYLESAIAAIDQGRKIFASLVCASKFENTALPVDGETKDYLSLLSGMTMPSGEAFSEAKMSMELIDGEATYTTSLGVKIDTQTVWAYFRHQPGAASKGSALVFHSGLGDGLHEANALKLDNHPPPSHGSTNTNAVAVQYNMNAETDLVVALDKVTFKGSNHPANYVGTDGLFDLVAIGKENAGNGLGDNIVRSVFNQPAAGGGTGIVGWTASLSDAHWRSFAYEVTVASDGVETAQSTFGFAPSYDQGNQTLQNPAAGKGMFCSWNQGTETGKDAGDYLTPMGPSRSGYNAVQYQVSKRASSSDVFVHDSGNLAYTVGDPECGSTNTLATNDENGAIDGFTPPTPTSPTALGGVALDAASIDLE